MFKDKPQSALKTFIVRIKGNKSSTRAIRVDYHSIIVKHFLISQADLVERKLTQEITFVSYWIFRHGMVLKMISQSSWRTGKEITLITQLTMTM